MQSPARPPRAPAKQPALNLFPAPTRTPKPRRSINNTLLARYGTPTSAIYNELEGLTTLLRYDSIPIGCCGIVLHPQWHRRAYPVTLFTLAPLETLQSAFAHAESTWSEGQTDARRDHESLSYASAGGCA